MSDTLTPLREQIAACDRELLALLQRRLQFAAAVGEQKKALGVPLRDYDVEQQVLRRADVAADELGLSPGLARGVMQLLIAESRAHQERLTYSQFAGEHQDILVVGGAGKMGRWLADFFANQGHAVRVYDPAAADSVALDEGVAWARLVVLATPLDQTAPAIEQVTALRPNGVVCDVASLKGHLKPAIGWARSAGVAITSIHPMFGPNIATLADRVICVCDCGDATATARVEELFRDTAATLVKLSLDEHDRVVTQVLGLSHLVNLLFGETLRRSGFRYDELARIGSTTFASQMQTTGSVLRENPELYYAIQRHNLNSPELYGHLRDALTAWTRSVERADAAGFVDLMDGCRRWLEADQ